MNYSKTTFFLIGVSAVLGSCSKDNVDAQEKIATYSNLEVGNFWVYNWYETNSNSEELIYEEDTVMILSDTIINEKKYFIRSNHTFSSGSEILFDSVNSVYSFPSRQILFTLNQEETDVIEFGSEDNPIAIGTYELDSNLQSVSTPAGVFDCLNWKGTIVSTQENYAYGIRYNDNFYSKDIGLIKMKTHFSNTPNDLEMRLVKFGNLSD